MRTSFPPRPSPPWCRHPETQPIAGASSGAPRPRRQREGPARLQWQPSIAGTGSAMRFRGSIFVCLLLTACHDGEGHTVCAGLTGRAKPIASWAAVAREGHHDDWTLLREGWITLSSDPSLMNALGVNDARGNWQAKIAGDGHLLCVRSKYDRLGECFSLQDGKPIGLACDQDFFN